MTQLANGILILKTESPQTCSTCGAIKETRPYGKGGAQVCFDCAMADIETTDAQFKAVLDKAKVVALDLDLPSEDN